jgi:hypothetical protein
MEYTHSVTSIHRSAEVSPMKLEEPDPWDNSRKLQDLEHIEFHQILVTMNQNKNKPKARRDSQNLND